MISNAYFSNDEFARIVQRYCNLVEKNVKEKIPYKSYRKITALIGCEETIHIYFNETENKAIISPTSFSIGPGEDTKSNLIEVSLSSDFGRFLEENKMPTTSSYNYNTTSTPLTSTSNIYVSSAPWMDYSNQIDKTNININGVNITGEDGKLKVNGKEVLVKENMDMMKNISFGPATGAEMSMYGIAIKNAAGEWVSYDKENHGIINVETLHFDAEKLIYKVPVGIDQIQVGDVVFHNKTLMIIIDKYDDGTFAAVDPYAGEEKTILPTRNMFGFNFMTKLVSIMDMAGAQPDAENPFGKMLPLILAGGGEKLDPMMLMFMNGGNMDFSNPMMMYFMMKDRKNDDMLPFLMMMSKGH